MAHNGVANIEPKFVEFNIRLYLYMHMPNLGTVASLASEFIETGHLWLIELQLQLYLSHFIYFIVMREKQIACDAARSSKLVFNFGLLTFGSSHNLFAALNSFTCNKFEQLPGMIYSKATLPH